MNHVEAIVRQTSTTAAACCLYNGSASFVSL